MKKNPFISKNVRKTVRCIKEVLTKGKDVMSFAIRWMINKTV